MAGTKKSAPPVATIGILGGTGLYEIEGFRNRREVRLRTPFGEPSGPYVVGALEGRRVAFLARHGQGHRLLPAEVPYRANIFGFKKLGVERLISINSVGSLREDLPPRDIVLPDQFFDRTRRPNTFFGGGLVAHVSLGQPVCPDLAAALHDAAAGLGLRARLGGTYVCIDGPAFSTKAESKAYRSWGGTVVGMTAATEARLCREAEICYATLCLVTDYDVWHETEEPVTVEIVLQNLSFNMANAKEVIRKAVAAMGKDAKPGCDCGSALRNAIVTAPAAVPAATKRALAPIVGKYLG
ncbi:MAG TPA: S-methyl-5'-thioadenosine phosphorylase [Candidatus Aminicenantes bacterium]|nr:S-methyl-5'-thioadenosine phosphorylase [Candidatus Aminicenantes bacterium]HRY65461.1 S-methyl-5'-thioadenosine phosphorylase [Candidatus Aminicenantes bacterium]HRZ72071.1 S-methyl-5'-thioadenosine phosphorylase [Candidatus Aminicenantes bacterium]